MKKRSWMNIKAVTLFEMLLVLFVSSLVAVSTFQYQQQQNEAAVADPLAQRMYLYAQTVRQFVVDNQAVIAAGTLNPFTAIGGVPAGSSFTVGGSGANAVYTITGVAWLQALLPPGSQTPYLPKAFTFSGLNPLQLQRGSLIGDAAIQVQISVTKVAIAYGALYDLNANGKLEGSVTATAATKANKLYDPLLGVSSFTYTGGVDKSGNVVYITAVWDKTQTQQTYMNSPDVTGNLNIAGGINLSPGAPTGNPAVPPAEPDITGVGTLAFDQSGAAAVDNLDTVNFSAPNGTTPSSGTTGTTGSTGTPYMGGQINNLYNMNITPEGSVNGLGSLNFANDPNNTGFSTAITGIHTITFDSGDGASINFSGPNASINGLKTLNFGSGSSVTGLEKLTGMQSISFNSGSSITGLGSITFASGATFYGLQNFFTYPYTNNRAEGYTTIVNYNGSNISTNSWYCALMRVDDQNAKANDRICNMYINSTQNYAIYLGANMVCTATCFQYGQ